MYNYESGEVLGGGESMVLDYEDLLPGMKLTNAVATQFYANGGECEVTEFNGAYHDKDETSMLRYGYDALLISVPECLMVNVPVCTQCLRIVFVPARTCLFIISVSSP